METRDAATGGTPRIGRAVTLVVSDVHAFPEFLDSAVRLSGFRPGKDRLVFAGDLLDRGGRPGECLKRLKELRAEMLIGDHDHATMVGYPISEQSPASAGYRQVLLRRFGMGALDLVACVEGVLISHAGISRAFAPDFEAVGGDPARLAELINAEYRRDLERQLAAGLVGRAPRTLDRWSPLWLRVDDPGVGPERLLGGAQQIAGHTSPSFFTRWRERDFRRAGLHLIDPGSYGLGLRDHPRHYRYAVIDRGKVEVFAGAGGGPAAGAGPGAGGERSSGAGPTTGAGPSRR